MRKRSVWLWINGFLGLVSIWAALLFAPRAQWPGPRGTVLGEVQRIFYFHVPLAWMMFFTFGLAAWWSFRYLATRDLRFDLKAASAVEVGLLFSVLAIVTGSLWAKPAWGVYWTWDPRLTTILLLFLGYVAYALLRSTLDDPERRARLSAVVGLVVFLNVPLTYFSVRLWRSLHPIVFLEKKGAVNVSPPMLATLLVNLVFFTSLGLFLIRLRERVGRMEQALELEEAP